MCRSLQTPRSFPYVSPPAQEKAQNEGNRYIVTRQFTGENGNDPAKILFELAQNRADREERLYE